MTFWIHFLSGLSIFGVATLHTLPKFIPNLPSIVFTVLNYIILLSIPIAISLYLLNRSNPNNTKYTKVYIILISVLWFLKVVTLLGISYMNIMLVEKYNKVLPTIHDNGLINSSIKFLNTSQTLKEREEHAKALYRFSGNQFVYLGERNNFVLYQPSKKDESEREKFLKLEESVKNTRSSMISQAATYILWALKYILALSTALIVTLIISKKKTNEK